MMKFDKEQTALNIYNAIKSATITQRKVAEELGVSDLAVHKWTNGKAVPTHDNIADLCNLLNCMPYDLLAYISTDTATRSA